ncbi:hypothetical protein MCOR25_006815 [Pyricularia grisea]|uniref:Translation initiation factor 3 N-terminal domain-containing protein n=1 Tax=Pyricularia grisea TaxID=148305 RepID=A0A6P8B066_PYRGI|nr:uncharacterized protein PgNI_06889 [Pyricularia grisea]KAI6360202.1 hypothetical protein MCOR25_006815 [Pyricularia grisea]TLD08211.1 hypothetical protein PgNI_06889 [Pyricularia grisea]
MICPKALAVRSRPVAAGCMRMLASTARPTICLAQLASRALPTVTDQRLSTNQIRCYASKKKSAKSHPGLTSANKERGSARRNDRDEIEEEEEEEEDDDDEIWNFKKMGRFPRDEELLQVCEKIVFREATGLSEPQSLAEVLKNADLKTNQLECIALPGPTNRGLLYPVCRFMNREQLRREQKEKERAARKTKVMTKEMEINWAITKHDLGHKMKQLLKFLQKGCQCEITFQNKVRGKKKATMEEMQETVRLVKEAIMEIPGANEYKSADGSVGSPVYRMFWQATPKKGAEKESS